MRDVPRVGGKNASLGELLRQLGRAGVRAVGGFATSRGGVRGVPRGERLREP